MVLQADEGLLLGGSGRRDGRIQEEDAARLARALQVHQSRRFAGGFALYCAKNFDLFSRLSKFAQFIE